MESVFEKLFSPLCETEFKSKLFGKQPFCLSGFPSRKDGLFSSVRFFDCLVSCENVRVVFKGLRQASIAPNDAKQMIAAGGTICATGVEQGDTFLRDIIGSLKKELQYTGYLSFRAYLSPTGAGFDAHYDPRVVTTIQIEGVKKWFYANRPVEELPLCNSPIPIPELYLQHLDAVGYQECTLHPGDLLCLPAGTLHWAEADSESLALNLAFDYIGETIADRVSNYVRRELLLRDTSRQAPFLPLSESVQLDISDAARMAIVVLEMLKQHPERLYD